jgi:hypothetical protein
MQLPSNNLELSRLAESLARAESSTRGEGIDPDDNLAYLEVKRRLLTGEISLGDAHALYDELFFKFLGADATEQTDGCN